MVLDKLDRGHREALDPQIPFYEGRTGDRALLAKIAREHEIDSCIHFAALAYVGESVEKPAEYCENNLEEGIAMMSALEKAGVRRLVLSSTAAVYGEPKKVPIVEDREKWPKNPYGWSNLFLERLLESFDTAYGSKFMALRYFNAAGATETQGEDHEPETHLIPNVLAAAAGEKPHVSVFGNNYPTPNGTPVRDYIHVADLADAHILALEHLRRGGASACLNLGTGQGNSVLELIETARQVTGRPIPVRMEAPRPGDPASLVADSSRAKSVLKWGPKMSSLKTIIETAWNWRMRYSRGYFPHAE